MTDATSRTPREPNEPLKPSEPLEPREPQDGAPRAPNPVVLVDARGLRCPLPVLRLAQALDSVPVGTHVRLLATDPAAQTDVAAFARIRGMTLVSRTDEGDHTAYVVGRLSATTQATASATPPRADAGMPPAAPPGRPTKPGAE